MKSERSLAAHQAWGVKAISAFAIISTSLGLGWPRASAASGGAAAKLLSTPLSFEPNQGQAPSTVQFLSRGSGYALYLAPGEVVLNLERKQPAATAATRKTREAASVDTLRMSLIGANDKASAAGMARQSGVVSYFIGNDPKQWHTGIPTYGKVTYSQLYPGVDLVFYGNQRQLEYDFVVAPGANPSRIAWRIEGPRASVDAEGNLALRAPNGPAAFKKPVAYQMDGDKRVNVDGSFAVAGKEVRFRIGSYDHSRALVIDPVLSYVTYLAGTGSDQISQTTGPGILENGSGQGIAIDAAGSAYVTGRTTSADIPTKNGYQMGQNKGGAPSAFVTKFSPDGSSLVYATYLGGSNWDYAYAIAVDSSGSAYVTGLTQSADFPITKGAYQTVCSPQPSNKVASANDSQSGCYGSTPSVFVTKLSPAGNSLVYSTFLGGYGGSYGTAIAVDSAGRAYVAGSENDPCNTSYTFQACFPTTAGATIPTSSANNVTNFCFAAVFDPAGANLLYSTLFGDLNGVKTTTSAGETMATGITVDSNGYFYLVGNSKAGKLPTTQGAVQPSGAPLDVTDTYLTAYRGFIAKFSPVTSGATLAACTYLGGKTGNTSDYLSGIAIDGSSNIYVVGYTNSTDFPVTKGAYSTVCAPGGGTCAAGHVTKLNSSLSSIAWSTYVGGARQDGGDNLYFTGPIQLDGKGNVYITGQANPNFPLLNSVEPTMCCGGGQVVVELDPTGSNLLFSTSIGSAGKDSMETGGLAVDSAGTIYVAGNNLGADLITTPGAFETTNPSPVPTCCYHGFVAKIAPTGPTVTLAPAGQVEPFAAESIVSVYGTDLASGTVAAPPSSVPTSLDGNTVTVTDSAGVARQAPLYFVSPSQINFEIPAGTVAGTATVTFQNQNGTTQAAIISIGSVSPGIFELNGSGLVAAWVLPVISGTQQPLQPVWQVVAGSVVALPVSLGPSTQQIYLEMFGTGIRNAKNVTVTVGGLSVPMLYAGPAPGYLGEDQVNIGPLPPALAGQGSVNIILVADGQQANVVTVTTQ